MELSEKQAIRKEIADWLQERFDKTTYKCACFGDCFTGEVLSRIVEQEFKFKEEKP
jgi:hypothetical protein